MAAGLGLLVPPLTSTLLGSVEKSRSGIAAGVLNATRQTGSVLGVALFGSLVGQTNAFMAGAHAALMISASLLIAAAAAILIGSRARNNSPEVRPRRRAAGHHSSTICARSAPIPVISTSSISPGFIHNGGLRLWPTPSGVPVAITSPGDSNREI